MDQQAPIEKPVIEHAGSQDLSEVLNISDRASQEGPQRANDVTVSEENSVLSATFKRLREKLTHLQNLEEQIAQAKVETEALRLQSLNDTAVYKRELAKQKRAYTNKKRKLKHLETRLNCKVIIYHFHNEKLLLLSYL